MGVGGQGSTNPALTLRRPVEMIPPAKVGVLAFLRAAGVYRAKRTALQPDIAVISLDMTERWLNRTARLTGKAITRDQQRVGDRLAFALLV